MEQMILDYAGKLGGPGLAVALGLYIMARKNQEAKKPDALSALMSDMRELSDAVLRLQTSVSSVSNLPVEMGRLSSEVDKLTETLTGLRVTVARMEGRIKP